MPELRCRVQSYIESSELTKEQRSACYASGSFTLQACPGSGKTRTVAARAAWRIATANSPRRGIAVVSFTNVACEQIALRLHDLGVPAGYPHFVGTIDSFIDKLVFMPYGQWVMKCRRPPELVLDHNRSWLEDTARRRMIAGGGALAECMGKGCLPTHFTYDRDGALVRCKSGRGRRQPKCDEMHCAKVKRFMHDMGFTLHSDAMYWAREVVRRHPHVAEAISARFEEIIVDEAQDTSDVQSEVLTAIWAAGRTTSLVRVGDPDQAIYDFGGERPDHLRKHGERTGTGLALTSNWRSSTAICRLCGVFASKPARPMVSAEGRDGPTPQLILYGPDGEPGLLQSFRERLEEMGIAPASAAVLAWAGSTLSRLSPTQDAWEPKGAPFTAALAQAAGDRDRGDRATAYQHVSDALLAALRQVLGYDKARDFLSDVGDLRWRRFAGAVLEALPGTLVPFREWTAAAKEAYHRLLAVTPWLAGDVGDSMARGLRTPNQPPAATVWDTLAPAAADDGPCLMTIHHAKGEEYEAVMVVADRNTGSSHPPDAECWLDDSVGQSGEHRVGYVAVSRARRLLVIAIPEDAPPSVLARLRDHCVVEQRQEQPRLLFGV